MIVQTLSGHYSEETAYLVADYPYGFKLRTQMKCWLHEDPKRGFRFMTRTLNPKTGRWNAPKASTYALVAAGMYLDENGHVEWTNVTEYTSVAAVLAFVEAFRGTPAITLRLQIWCANNARHAEQFANGTAHWAINGVKQERSESQKEEDRKDAEAWRAVAAALYLKPIEQTDNVATV